MLNTVLSILPVWWAQILSHKHNYERNVTASFVKIDSLCFKTSFKLGDRNLLSANSASPPAPVVATELRSLGRV